MKAIYCYLLVAITVACFCLAQAQVPQCVSTNPTTPRVLWINVNFAQYQQLSYNGYTLLKNYAMDNARGAQKASNVDFYTLTTDNINVDLNSYNQIWFVDFSSSADNYPNAYRQIASWVTSKSTTRANLVLDGRFASSFWLPFGGYANDHKTPNPQILYNYYVNLARLDGGLVVGTDHDNYHKTGANALLAALGITTGFSGKVFSSVLEVSTTHPLIIHPQNAGFAYPAAVPKGDTKPHFFIWDDSSTAVAPSGPFGAYNLMVVARHSDGSPAITSTITGTENPVCPFQACATSTCVERRCVYSPISCSGATPYCNPTDNKCYGCLTSTQCSDNNKCHVHTCTAGACTSSPVVCLGGQLCDQADGVCKQCIIDNDCNPPGSTINRCNPKRCQAGVCTTTNPVVCTAPTTCDPADGRCKACIANSDCNDGSACTVNTCTNGQCSYPPTATAANCPAGSKCDPIDGKCKQCKINADCVASDKCSIGSCSGTGQCSFARRNCGQFQLCDPTDGSCKSTAQVPTVSCASLNLQQGKGQIITLSATDPTAMPLTYTITALTNVGQLYQVNENGNQGALITGPTAVTNSQHKLYYVPPNGQSGQFNIFAWTATNGVHTSNPCTITGLSS